MQFRNSPLYQNIKGSPLVKMVLVFVVVLVALAIFLSLSSNDNKNVVKNEYYDAGSGETVSNPPGKATEGFGNQTTAAATLLGFSKLVDRGLTASQLAEVQAQVQNFSASQNPKINELSLETNSIAFITPDLGMGATTVTGNLKANRNDPYVLELSYDSITNIRVVIKKSNAVVFDSGIINQSETENNDY